MNSIFEAQSMLLDPMNPILRSCLKILAATISIALAAQLTIDIGTIPITGQTLAILAWAFFLSNKESFLTLSIYLLIGILGIPVFADGANGIDKLLGGSGGYLVGFLFAAVMVSYINSKYELSTLSSIFGLTLLGTLIILGFGVGRLIMMYGIEKGIEYGFLPFWQGALIKILFGSVLVWGIKKYLKVEQK